MTREDGTSGVPTLRSLPAFPVFVSSFTGERCAGKNVEV